jgi:hypothetical protein
MNEINADSNTSRQLNAAQQGEAPAGAERPINIEAAPIEHRQAYGTAKTENLRDSGAWRWLLPASVILGCIALLAIPLIILVPLLINSLDPTSSTYGLLWLWITMIVVEVAVAALIIWGLTKIFITQAGNYRS